MGGGREIGEEQEKNLKERLYFMYILLPLRKVHPIGYNDETCLANKSFRLQQEICFTLILQTIYFL